MPLSTPQNLGQTLDSSAVGVIGGQSVPFTFTMPAGNWEFITYRVSYLADATPLTRFVALTVFDDTGETIHAAGGGLLGANQLRISQYVTGAFITFSVGSPNVVTFPSGLVLHENWTLEAGAFNAQAGDMQTITFQFRDLP